MAMNESEATRILRDMARDREETWGFFFYRTCYYDDDTRWESFLERLKEFAESTLLKPRSYNKDGGGQILLNKLEWDIQSDPSPDGCSKEKIWRYEFRVEIPGEETDSGTQTPPRAYEVSLRRI